MTEAACIGMQYLAKIARRVDDADVIQSKFGDYIVDKHDGLPTNVWAETAPVEKLAA